MVLDEDTIQRFESEGQRDARKASLVLVRDRKIRIGGRCWMDVRLKKYGVKEEQPPTGRPRYVFHAGMFIASSPDIGWELRVGGTPSKITRIVEGERQGWYYVET